MAGATIRINPLDFEPDVAIGIGLPIIGGSSLFNINYTTLDQAAANAKNLLLTNKGERIMQPDFGCDLEATLFENITTNTLDNLEESIRFQFGYWLPYIFINELLITANEDSNKIYLSMTISLEGNIIDTRSVQLEIIPETL